eukprot:2358646-Alexandrium_andersonii.AAC.1
MEVRSSHALDVDQVRPPRGDREQRGSCCIGVAGPVEPGEPITEQGSALGGPLEDELPDRSRAQGVRGQERRAQLRRTPLFGPGGR